MTVTVTVRPGGARTEIRDLPFGKPGDGYRIIGTAIEATQDGMVKYDRKIRAFTVARGHTTKLIEALAARYGVVKVIQHGGLTKCVSACWGADPDSTMVCECSCAGANHATGKPIGRVVSAGGASGSLSVAPAPPRTYVVRRP